MPLNLFEYIDCAQAFCDGQTHCSKFRATMDIDIMATSKRNNGQIYVVTGVGDGTKGPAPYNLDRGDKDRIIP